MPDPELVVAAGAVVLRRSKGRTQVLVVHRERHDDWTLPKGKLDPGESARTAAVREVQEETGVRIRLGPPLADQVYLFRNGDSGWKAKLVHWWVGHATEEVDVTTYQPNDEIDEVRWLSVEQAAAKLTYERDHETVAAALQHPRTTYPLLVLRHTEANPRKTWRGDDRKRTLTKRGERQAERLVPLLEAYGVRRLVSSSSRRCSASLLPYAEAAGGELTLLDELSEEDATEAGVAEVVRSLDHRQATVLCTHRPVLPMVFRELGIDPPELDKGALLVLHRRKGRIASIEHVPAP